MISLQIEGIEQMGAKVQKLAKDYPKAARSGVARIARETKSESKQMTPVKTGFLKANTRTRMIGQGHRVGFVMFNDAQYAQYVEYLHPTQKGFFRIPIERLRRTFARRLARHIREEMGLR